MTFFYKRSDSNTAPLATYRPLFMKSEVGVALDNSAQ